MATNPVPSKHREETELQCFDDVHDRTNGKRTQSPDVVVSREAASPDVPNDGPPDTKGQTVTDAAAVPQSENQVDTIEAYSVWSTNEKRMIVFAGSLAGFFSPLTGSIYYPATTEIARDLGVSISQINLTITTYLIVQGLAPMMIAGFSDSAGRRPAYFVCFGIYLVANLGLGLQDKYAALLVLRMVQSGGSSGTIALAQGVVGDVITSAERGSYIAFTSVTSILGPTLSPILGGVLSQYLGWHSVFWFLLILAGVFCIPLFIAMPETCRKVVGDGSFPPPRLNMNLTDKIRFARRERADIHPDPIKQEALRKNYRIRFPNPLSTLVVLTDFESAILLGATGLAMANFYALATSISADLSRLYGFNELKISLMFIPIGCGGIVSAFTTGRMVDWNYRRHARKLNFPVLKNRQQDLINFPIERARMEIALPLLLLGAAGLLAYGWIMVHKVSLAGPIIVLFIMGYALMASFAVLNVLMIDIYPGQAAAATAANNISRCELGAAASAAIEPMISALGHGWAYTVLAGLFVAFSPLLLWTMMSGMKWRQQKRAKKERKLEGREKNDRGQSADGVLENHTSDRKARKTRWWRK